jgi:hypothetical protein
MSFWRSFPLLLAVGLLCLEVFCWYHLVRKARAQGRRLVWIVVAALLLRPWIILVAIREPPVIDKRYQPEDEPE